ADCRGVRNWLRNGQDTAPASELKTPPLKPVGTPRIRRVYGRAIRRARIFRFPPAHIQALRRLGQPGLHRPSYDSATALPWGVIFQTPSPLFSIHPLR